MFERFTDGARRVVVLAQEESRLFNHDHIGTEHFLAALIHEGKGVAAEALGSLGVELDDVRKQVDKMFGRGEQPPAAHIPFLDDAKRVLEYSLREALRLGHNYIGTEHILLGLVSQKDTPAVKIISELGQDESAIRLRVLEFFNAPEYRERNPGTTAVQPTPVTGPWCRGCRADLSETIAYSTMEIPENEGKDHITATLVYCSRCGSSQGVLP